MKKRVISLILALVMLFSMLPGDVFAAEAASVEVPLNATNFPDAVFREYVSNYFDSNTDGQLSNDETAWVNGLYLSDMGISSLKGVEYFTSLCVLSCENNQLTELDVSGCSALTNLYCENNQLTELNVSGCTALIQLHCENNKLTTLDVSSCTALTNLFCGNNQLTKLDLSGCIALRNFLYENNQLTTLNVSDCTSLWYLDCRNGQLTTLDASGCTALIQLYCENNKLTTLDVSGCTALYALSCENNQLAELNLKDCTTLSFLSCENNQLASLDISDCTDLRELHCFANHLTVLDGSNCKKLWAVDARDCPDLEYVYLYDRIVVTPHVNEAAKVYYESNRWCILLNKDNAYDLVGDSSEGCPASTYTSDFDISKASNWVGGTVSGNIMTVDPGATAVTGSYDNGSGRPATFTFEILPYDYFDQPELARAITEIRGHMLARNSDYTVTFKLPDDGKVTDAFRQYFPAYMGDELQEHTGDPEGGDYLRQHWWAFGPWVDISAESENGYYTVNVGNGGNEFIDNAEQAAEIDAAVEAILTELNLNGKSDYEKIYAVYKYMVDNIEYDYDGVYDPGYSLTRSAYGAAVLKKCVCSGYAALFYRLMLELGIDARIVDGDSVAGLHAWNIVKLEDEYYYVDATWDAGGWFPTYFLRGEEFFAIEHDGHLMNLQTLEFAGYNVSKEDYKKNDGDSGNIDNSAPTLSANGLSDAGKPKLKWTEAKDAVKYRVFRRVEGASAWSTYTLNSLTYTHSSAESGKTYEYQVCAVYADGTLGPKSEVVKISAEQLVAPTLSANGLNSANKPKLKWTAVKDAAKYRVFRRVEGTSAWSTYTLNSLTYTHSSAESGKTYEYQVCAVYADGTLGPKSNVVKVKAAAQLVAPTLTANGLSSANKPKLKWTAVEGAAKYRVFRRVEGTSTWSTYTLNSLTYTHTSAENGKTYEYQVCAIDANGNLGPKSNVVKVKAAAQLAAPTLTANGLSSANKPKLKWAAVAGAVKYRVFRRVEGTSAWSTYTLNSLTYTHTSAENGKTYEYQVCAVYADGTLGPKSNVIKVYAGTVEQLVAPTLTANGLSSANKPKLKWAAVEGAVKYRVFRRVEGTSAWSTYTLNSLTYTHTSAVNGKTYEYQVCAIDADGNLGTKSNTVKITAN